MSTLRTHIDLPYIRDVRQACYTPDRLAELYDRPHTVVEVLLRRDGKWHDVPDADRLWTVLDLDLIDARTLRLFACDCADRALDRERDAGRAPDQRSVEAVRVARLYADGKATADELADARYAAARAAADAAFADAARAARVATADAAAFAAFASAAFAADAADDGVAERRWQVEHLAAMLGAGGAA